MSSRQSLNDSMPTSKKPLVQISVTTSPEADDAVSDMLERVTGQTPSIWSKDEDWISVVTVYIHTSTASARLWKTGIREGLKRIAACGLDVDPATIHVRTVRMQDWAESWKRHFRPLDIDGVLLVQPTWSRRKPRRDQKVVRLDPGLSFGTGQHATTRFCLEQVVRLRPRVGASTSLIDMGTGSGILAIAAARLGYSPVVAFDFDPDCVRIARENAALNEAQAQVRLTRADVTLLPSGRVKQYDVVVANLMYDVLIAERDRILARLKPAGVLVLAGILESQFEKVARSYRAGGCRLLKVTTDREWRSGSFRFRA
ncbi:MAG: 50S ribosomal protein L11 methyltransferase [Pedosphaera sp.]|nr:50S ribosomal protein L11 methyltransferase [Pedosphaera sp.]